MIDYRNRTVIAEELQRCLEELKSGQRPEWYDEALSSIQSVGVYFVQSGVLPPQAMEDYLMGMGFWLGIVAERNGWPLRR